MLHLILATAASVQPVARAAWPALASISLPRVTGGEPVNLGAALEAPGTNLLVFGTYPADVRRKKSTAPMSMASRDPRVPLPPTV